MKKFKFNFKPSDSGKQAEEIIQELVEQTIKKVLAEQETKYYNRLKEHTS
ncbi:hypothetical protein [Neobacillus ginsengisoli]|uniref:Uncharacterized protein n=1 Tax=Neobacillus ginsengisoli TaxID=904295 RepID=A0ABT9XNT8_9BACI|nr:hypothetical protein [Neobacillus ginsengisoli]MDQ0197098.1 hypothetical protein [Neobacillus ginsengisoli]